MPFVREPFPAKGCLPIYVLSAPAESGATTRLALYLRYGQR